MEILEQHRSPDGLLRLLVLRDQTGDVAIGFDGHTWHTHANILASRPGVAEDKAIREFVDHIINDEAIIAVSRIGGAISEAWPTEDPKREVRYKPAGETLEFRRWSGRLVEVS